MKLYYSEKVDVTKELNGMEFLLYQQICENYERSPKAVIRTSHMEQHFDTNRTYTILCLKKLQSLGLISWRDSMARFHYGRLLDQPKSFTLPNVCKADLYPDFHTLQRRAKGNFGGALQLFLYFTQLQKAMHTDILPLTTDYYAQQLGTTTVTIRRKFAMLEALHLVKRTGKIGYRIAFCLSPAE